LTVPACSDEEFIHYFETLGALKTADRLKINVRRILTRRRRIEKRYGISLKTPQKSDNQPLPFSIEPLTVQGTVVIFSDAHFWPNVYTDAFWILLKVIRDIKPSVIINNGDAFDGAKVSRHNRIGWDKRPDVHEELTAVKTCLSMIEETEASLYWNWGNHDLRYDTYLSSHAPLVEGVHKTSLKDHFPKWTFQWGLMLNGNCVVKHRYKGGAGAGRNNTLHAGMSMVTGHDHHLQVTRFSDYRGSRYGVQDGTLAPVNGPQFDYCEGNPVDWQAGFVAGYFDGEEHWFEAVEVKNGKAMFGGRVWSP
jgi:hypothetical protein